MLNGKQDATHRVQEQSPRDLHPLKCDLRERARALDLIHRIRDCAPAENWALHLVNALQNTPRLFFTKDDRIVATRAK